VGYRYPDFRVTASTVWRSGTFLCRSVRRIGRHAGTLGFIVRIEDGGRQRRMRKVVVVGGGEGGAPTTYR
jgi:hypothetical protein